MDVDNSTESGAVYLDCLSESYSPRNSYLVYKAAGGLGGGQGGVPEYGSCLSIGSMYPMTRFRNVIGHL